MLRQDTKGYLRSVATQAVNHNIFLLFHLSHSWLKLAQWDQYSISNHSSCFVLGRVSHIKMESIVDVLERDELQDGRLDEFGLKLADVEVVVASNIIVSDSNKSLNQLLLVAIAHQHDLLRRPHQVRY